MIFDPAQNRVQTCLLTPSELNEITTAKHGVQFYSGGSWHDKTGGEFFPTDVYRAKPAPARSHAMAMVGMKAEVV